MSEQSNVVDQLTDKLRASTVQDGAASDDWKNKLNLPAKDNRQQTEVCHSAVSTTAFNVHCLCMCALR
jgi:hypothetical protein